MALSEERMAWLQQLLETATDASHRLSQWERDFVADQVKRVEEVGANIRLSIKQIGVLERIEGKL